MAIEFLRSAISAVYEVKFFQSVNFIVYRRNFPEVWILLFQFSIDAVSWGISMNRRQNQNLRRKRPVLGILMIAMALIIMQIPVMEADAAYSVDFKMNGNTLVKYRGPDKNVTIPDTVEVIGRGAFEDNTNVELVVVPASVKRIDPYAFWGCENLDTVVLGKGLTEVGDYAFAGCKGLKQMTIPANITSIGIQAFADCVNMTDIGIPVETVKIHETAFDGCYRLTIHAEEYSVAEDYAKAFYERQKDMAGYEEGTGNEPSDPDAPVSTPVPTPVPGVTLGTTQIVGNAAVFLMDGSILPVYEGNPRSENDAHPLASLTGSGSIPKYTIVDGEIIADQAYYQNNGLGEVILPEGIKEVGQFSFARSSMTGVTVPQGTERIDYGAFYHCTSLERVTLPDTIRYVEPKAFSYTPWVENFLSGRTGNGDFLIEGGVLIAYRGNYQNVAVPEGVRVIAAEAFRNHTEIKSVTLPESLLVIGEGAFEDCNQLRKVTFGQNVEEIKDRAFSGVSSLFRNVSLPSSVKKLGLKAFANMWITYEGETPEQTYEVSATRLSNDTYRVYGNLDVGAPGVTTVGLEGAEASLEGADKSYTLTIEELAESSEMEAACQRAFQESLPENRVLYRMTLTDASGIPLTKLGTQALTVTFPVPEALRGQNLRLLALDRNGQVEAAAVESTAVNGVEVLRFQTNYLSQFAVYGIGADAAVLSEDVAMNHLSAGPDDRMPEDSALSGGRQPEGVKTLSEEQLPNTAETLSEGNTAQLGGLIFAGSVLAATGLILLTAAGIKKKQTLR